MKKILLILFIISFYFVSLVLFGSIVKHVSHKGPLSNNLIAKIIYNMSNIPSNLKTNIFGGNLSIQRKSQLPLVSKKKGLFVYQNENKKEYLLVSKYFLDESVFKLQLIDVLENSIIHTWPHKQFSKNLTGEGGPGRYTFEHSMLLDNGDALITTGGGPILRVDPCGKKIWENDLITHHSIEVDRSKNIWTPIYLSDEKKIHGQILQYHDGIANIDIKNGNTIYTKSLVEILIENNLFDLIGNSYIGKDPLHLNDIEPVLNDGPNWKKDDLFLSLRNISLVILYRPSTNKIIWYKSGPWRHQHDVDILSDTKIGIFNNNTELNLKSVNKNSEIITYDFRDKSIEKIFESAFKKHKIRTYYEGLFEKINDNSVYIEEQENGRIIKADNEGTIIWEYVWDAQVKWSRFYNSSNFKKIGELEKSIDIIKNRKCE